MTLRRVLLAMAVLATLVPRGTAALAASTIVTTQPAQGVPYNAAPIRQNFDAAASDINALQSMNAGASAPSSPVRGTLWLETPGSGTTYTLKLWLPSASAWVPIARLDSAAGSWEPPVGGGALPSIVSAATTTLSSVPQAAANITGSQSIASFGSGVPEGQIRFLVFTGSPSLVHNATYMILPRGVDIALSPGETALALSLGGGRWRVLGMGDQRATTRVPSTAFWGGPGVDQWAFPGRVFIGGGVADSGSNSPFPQSDWLSQLTDPGGEVSAFGTGIYSTVYILTNPSAVAGTPANIGTPTQALMAGNSSINSISTGPTTYSTPRTIECSMVNNVTAAPSGGGPNVPTWCHYSVAARTSANAGATYVAEFEVANFQAAVTGWTPESTSGQGTIALELGSGAGLSATGQNATTVAMYIAANPTQFGAGILMLNNAIGAYGPSSSPLPASAGPGATVTGLGLMYNQEIQFYASGLQQRIFGDTSGNLNLWSGSGNLNISGRITSMVGSNAILNAAAGQVAGLSVAGVTPNVNFNGFNFAPSANNTLTLGAPSLEFSAGYIKTLITDALPASAGAGGLYVCVDNVGVQYKKASCP